MDITNLISEMNSCDRDKRTAALSEFAKKVSSRELPSAKKTDFVNNHIHTTYSFSPYSPTQALYMAWKSGLRTAGIMDHDSVSGALEFIKAGEILGMPVTCGAECRASMTSTRLAGKRINNPDQKSVAYVALHGIPHQSIPEISSFFAPYRAKRNERNRLMCKNINEITSPFGIAIDFDADVLPISMAHDGGSVTERHILFALAKRIAAVNSSPEKALAFLTDTMRLPLSAKVCSQISMGNDTPQFYLYDILGALKSNMVERFYIDAQEECPMIEDVAALAHKTGAILAYAYLGDVGDSVTGDKKAQKFEDDYIELLFSELERIGFNAVTYMPSRNTRAQLERVMALCRAHNLFQISGEDINSPRQSFICNAMSDEMFSHLTDATYALIGHELAATADIDDAMFSEKTKKRFPDLDSRCAYFKRLVK